MTTSRPLDCPYAYVDVGRSCFREGGTLVGRGVYPTFSGYARGVMAVRAIREVKAAEADQHGP